MDLAFGEDPDVVAPRYDFSPAYLRKLLRRCTKFKDEIARVLKRREDRALKHWEKAMTPIYRDIEQIGERMVNHALSAKNESVSEKACEYIMNQVRKESRDEDEQDNRLPSLRLTVDDKTLKVIDGKKQAM